MVRVPPHKSGVKSAGNGPAMRAAIQFAALGCPDEPDDIDSFYVPLFRPWIDDSTHLTHIDRQAEDGAWVLWLTTSITAQSRNRAIDYERLCFWKSGLAAYVEDSDIGRNLDAIRPAYEANKSVAEFAAELKLTRGVTGYIAHTVPVAIYAFLKHPDDYRAAVESVIRLGGDTDTVAAITGAMVGARVGKAGIPKEWLDRWADWPRSVAWMERLALKLAEGKWRTSPQPAVPLAWWAIPFRNLFFFLLVLVHVFRRLLPPY